MNKNNKGFTLIELLIVIAIIGLLAGIVLVSLQGARVKAKDARIIADMDQLRSIAEMYYIDNGSSYENLATSSEDYTKISNDINNQNGGQMPTAHAKSDAYCVYAKLNKKSTTNHTMYWCIDSTGVSNEYAADNHNFKCDDSSDSYTCE